MLFRFKVFLFAILFLTAMTAKSGNDIIFKSDFEFICGTPSLLGPWDGHPIFGASYSENEYVNDSNLDTVIASAPAIQGEEITGLSLNVTGAIVHNYGAQADKVFWLADANGSMRTFLTDAVNPVPQPGDSVSFTVTRIANFFGELEITGLTNWSVDSSGNDVLIRDGQSVEFVDSTLRYTYQAYGKILSAIGPCGTNTTCWNFEHGTEVSELRIRNDVGVSENSCVHVIAPVYYFMDNALFDITNWDWIQSY